MHHARLRTALQKLLLFCWLPAFGAAPEFTPMESCFSGSPGSMPQGWINFKNAESGTGLTNNFQWDGHPVFRIVSGKDTAVIHSGTFEFPSKGILRFSVWARATVNNARIKLLIVGDSYRSYRTREAMLTETFQRVTVEMPVPVKILKSNTFWFRIDAPPTGNDFLIAKVKTELLPPVEVARQTGNILTNGEFHFGASGFQREYYNRIVLDKTAPVFQDNRCVLAGPYFLFSDAFTYRPGTVYTAVARMKRAAKGKPATARLILLPFHYRGFIQREFPLEDEYRTYVVQGELPPSRYNRMALRVDALDGTVEISRLQLVEGPRKEFLPRPSVELGVTGNINFDAGDTGAKLNIRLLQNETPRADFLAVEVRDAFGKIVRSEKIAVPAQKEFTFPLAVDTSLRGVFFVTLSFGGDTAKARYAVVKKLKGKTFSQNMLAGHLQPLQSPDLSLFERYLPISPNINRFFMEGGKEALRLMETEPFRKQYRTFPFKNVICLRWEDLHESGFDTWLENKLTPELEKKILARLERFAGIARECNFYGVELFNEPHLWKVRSGNNIGSASMPPEKTARLYAKAYPILKQHAPELKVFGPCTHFQETQYNERFLKAGGADHIDAFTFHSYNEDPDSDHVAEQNLELKKLVARFRPDLPVINTEIYYGVRDHSQSASDEESRRAYFKNSELEHAAVYAAFYANSAASGVPFSAFSPSWLCGGVPNTPQHYVLASGAALNAAIELLGNCGEESRILHLDSQIRCFLFPQAQGGAVATLRVIPSGNSVDIRAHLPEGIQIYDLFGNRISSRNVKLSSAIHYLKFAPGMDAEKILNDLPLDGLPFPFDASLTIWDVNTLAVKVRNRGRKPGELSVQLKKLPGNWIAKTSICTQRIAPQEEKLFLFPMREMPLNRVGEQSVILALRAEGGQQDFLRRLNAFPVRYSADFKFRPQDYAFYGVRNLGPDWHRRPCRGDADCSARVGALWNERGLMLSVETEDDRFVPPATYGDAYKQDSLQIYFDMKNDSSRRGSNANRSDDLTYLVGELAGKQPFAFLEFAEGTRYIGTNNATTGLDSAVEVGVAPGRNKGRRYRIFFSRETLYQVPFKSGTVLGFSMLINDNDGEGRKQGITLTPPGTEPHGNPQLFRDMVLLHSGDGTESRK